MKEALLFDIPDNMAGLRNSWFVLSRSHDLKRQPVRRFLFNKPIVLFRVHGKAVALLDYCPHRGVPLSGGRIDGENLRCCYHGWLFNAKGQCVGIPGLVDFAQHPSRDACALPLHEQDGLIWCCPSPSPLKSLPHFSPNMGRPKHYNFIWETAGHGELIDVLENFLDGAHTHFVHAGLVRHHEKRQRIKAEIRRTPDYVEIEYSQEKNQSGFLSQWMEGERLGSTARFIVPSIAELEYRSRGGSCLVITAYATPTVDNAIQVTAVISVQGSSIGGWIKRLIMTPFFKKVLAQDKRIVEMQNSQRKYFCSMPYVSTPIDVMRSHMELLVSGRSSSHLTHAQSLYMDF